MSSGPRSFFLQVGKQREGPGRKREMEDWNMERDHKESKILKAAGQDGINKAGMRVCFQKEEKQT